ncbi:MAG: transposase [Kiritimatiellia bacterium]
MRALRSFKPDRWYHLISRIANRAFYLTAEERTRFVERLWRVAKFSGIEVPAYCLMSNHFHLLVHLPEAPELSDGELFDRIAAPALVDALTGAIYEVGPGAIGKTRDGKTSYALPIYDSPLLLMDGSLATGKGKE